MTPTQNAQRAWRWITVFTCVWTIIGCSDAQHLREADLHLRSRATPNLAAPVEFNSGLYSIEGKSSLTVLLTDGPVDAPRRALIVRMFWRPKAAATPLDETATNATVQYIVFGGDGPGGRKAVGIYSGGGFIYPETEVGAPNLQANLWQATLTLAEQNVLFEDTLGPSILAGRFNAQRDDEGIVEAIRKVNIAVSQALGKPRFVSAD